MMVLVVSPSIKPSQYVDVEFQRVRGNVRQQVPGFGWEPEFMKLFGNKAVRYRTSGLGDYTIIVGYFRADQLPKSAAIQVPEYLVRIASTIDDHQFLKLDEKSKDLIDTVIKSLRVIR